MSRLIEEKELGRGWKLSLFFDNEGEAYLERRLLAHKGGPSYTGICGPMQIDDEAIARITETIKHYYRYIPWQEDMYETLIEEMIRGTVKKGDKLILWTDYGVFKIVFEKYWNECVYTSEDSYHRVERINGWCRRYED